MLLLLVLIAGCKGIHEPEEPVVMPLSICLPTNELQTFKRMPSQNHAIGDPGMSEQFLVSKYIYFIILKDEDGNWSVWQTIERETDVSDWEAKTYAGSLQTAGDSIYRYTENIVLMLSNKKIRGHVYAIASSERLTFNKPLDELENLDDVLNLTFDASSINIQRSIQNIYTTPYNYEVSGAYYGLFSSFTQRVPHVNLMLYHIAAKVDLKWNVAEEKRVDKTTPSNAVRLTYLGVRRLYNQQAYCFMPMRNTLPDLPTSGYAIDSIVTPADEGLWWEGRSYFYTIPYTVEGEKDYFPLQLVMRTNGTSGTGYELMLQQPIDTTDVFVPWLRGNFVFNSPLQDETATKIAN